MQVQIKIPGPVEIICRISAKAEADRKVGDVLYHECLAHGGALRFGHPTRMEGHFDHAIFLAEVEPRAVNGFEGRALQVFTTKLVSLVEAAPVIPPTTGKKAEAAGATK